MQMRGVSEGLMGPCEGCVENGGAQDFLLSLYRKPTCAAVDKRQCTELRVD